MIYDITALRGIMEAYVADPSLISSLYITEKDLPTPDLSLRYRWQLEILHTCANKGYKTLTEDLIENVIDTYTSQYPPDLKDKTSVQEALKNDFREIQKLVKKNPEPTNAQAHYEVIQKCIALSKLQSLGYDISPFYYTDTDPAKAENARNNFDRNSVQDILDHYTKSINNDIQEISSQLKITSDYIPLAARDIPGADKESIFLIGQEETEESSSLPPYAEWMELGTFNSVIGAAKAGKTQLMMQMAFAIQNGFPLWDLPVMKGDVLYVDFELSPKQINKRMRYLRNYFSKVVGKELTLDNTEDMKYLAVSKSFAEGKVDLPGIIEACQRYKAQNPNLRMIVFDCFYTFAEGDPNLEQDAKLTLQPLKSLVDDQTTVCYVHHTNKNGFNDIGDVIYAASGSGIHGKIVDSTYVVYPVYTETKNSRTLQSFRIATTGRSSCGGSFDCKRDKSTSWFFDKLPDDGNQQPDEENFE